MIFVDTGAWYASEVEDDVNHSSARSFLVKASAGGFGVLVTTDYVLDETLTLLRARRGLRAAVSFLDKVQSSKSVRVAWVDQSLFERGAEIMRKSEEKAWSFTDCTSFALMNQLSIQGAFAFDGHFRQAGFAMHP